jgi:hypothetical protein
MSVPVEERLAFPSDLVCVLSVRTGPMSKYLGTAFPFHQPGLWLTAKHCVAGQSVDDIFLTSTTMSPIWSDRIRAIHMHPRLDLALLQSSTSDPIPVWPLAYASGGLEVSVIGYPEDLFLDRSGIQRPRVRMMRGHIQRIELDGAEANETGDFELSFACPGGMSGSPLIPQTASAVVGMVIGNRESMSGSDVVASISFGAAVDLRRAEPWLSECVSDR